MKTKCIPSLLRFAAWLGVAAMSIPWLGCQRNAPAVDRQPPQAASTNRNESASDYKTVEQLISADPDKADREFTAQLQKFQNEGWNVLSISKAMTRPDGTRYRKFELGKAK